MADKDPIRKPDSRIASLYETAPTACCVARCHDAVRVSLQERDPATGQLKLRHYCLKHFEQKHGGG